METLYYAQMHSAIGPLWVVVSNMGLVMIEFGDRKFPPPKWKEKFDWLESEGKTAPARKELAQYFDGRRTDFTVPLDLRTGTEFQRQCWGILTKIPYGEIRSYQEVAKAAGRPAASRAVGQANHANPIPIVIPCHRVINADGHLGGYGGGLDVKEQLLALERALPGSGPIVRKQKTKVATSRN
jgi:O-6-methylguanine DNA methyltransferase